MCKQFFHPSWQQLCCIHQWLAYSQCPHIPIATVHPEPLLYFSPSFATVTPACPLTQPKLLYHFIYIHPLTTPMSLEATITFSISSLSLHLTHSLSCSNRSIHVSTTQQETYTCLFYTLNLLTGTKPYARNTTLHFQLRRFCLARHSNAPARAGPT